MNLRGYKLLFFCILVLSLTSCSTSGIYHPVQSGETLGQIARTYGFSEAHLARINRIDSPQSLPSGQIIFIPGATTLRTSPVKKERVQKPAPQQNKVVTSPLPSPSIPLKKIERKEASTTKKVIIQKAKTTLPLREGGQFSWPLQGSILRRFGDKNPFPCKGIEISVPPGTPVLAAAAGRVIYSGDGISSFGNMIILRHDDDFYSVYAFAQKNLVSVGTFVSQKERIALSGVPPQQRSPRLYFELRYHKDPVDPIFYLP